MKKIALLLSIAMIFAVGRQSQAQGLATDMEESGNSSDIMLTSGVDKSFIPDFFTDGIPEGGLLLVPESTGDRVMAFDPVNGALLNPDFIPDDGSFSTPIKIILNATQTSLLISDQLGDVVYEYDFDGNLIGIFAPAGGVNTGILDNARGTCLKPNGNLLVTVGGGNNMDCVIEFDQSGNYLGRFTEAASGGLDSPFDVMYRPDYDDYLVSGYSSDAIHRYDANGNYLDDFASNLDALEQLAFSLDGNVLCAGYSADGVYEFSNDGTLIGFYPGVNGIRGVYELPDGLMMVTDGQGVHKFSRTDGIIETIISGASARFITFVNPVFTSCQHTLALYDEGGDGWNGAILDVYVRGVLTYDNLSLENGSGPEEYLLEVFTTDEVAFEYATGSTPQENYYTVINHIGDVVFEDGLDGQVPAGGSFIADCDAIPMGTITGTIVSKSGTPLENVRISVGDYTAFSLANGTYSMAVATGNYTVSAEKKGFITQSTENILIDQNAVVAVDFTLEKVPPFTIPFYEDWQEVSFDYQLWGFEPEQGNWEISTNSDYGNPAPGARFNWSPSQTGYSNILASYEITVPERQDRLALQFDLHLNNYSALTIEGLEVLVLDNNQWKSVHNFDNQKGSIPFTTYFFDIGELIAGSNIKIGFRAYGENSFNINGWGLDNIYVVEAVNISGTVSKLTGGDPIENAEVVIGNYEPLLTGVDGSYSLDVVPGTYTVAVSKTGFNQLFFENVEISGAQVFDCEMTAPTLEPNLQAVVEVLEPDQTTMRELTISNNGDGPVDWYLNLEFGPEDKMTIPSFEGVMNHGKDELSEGRAPGVNQVETAVIPEMLSGSTAFGFEIYPAKKLISFETDLPGTYQNAIDIAMDIFAADFDNNGNLYAINNDNGDFYLADTESGMMTLIGPSITATDLAYDKLNGIMYAVDYESPHSKLYTIDTQSGATTLIGNCGPGLIISLACDGNGNLWGFNITDDSFYFINKFTGQKTLMGPVGFDGNFAQSMAWDPKTDKVYMAAFNNTELRGELRLVDRQTGSSMLLGVFPEGAEIAGFGFPAGYSPWISVSPTNGMLSPEKVSQTISINFDASGMVHGDLKQASLKFHTMPDLGEINVEAALGIGQQKIDLYPGWSGISSNRDITGWPLEEMPATIIGGSMEIMIGADGFFWPSQNLNLLGDWNAYQGYKLKMAGDGYLLVNEPELEDQTVSLNEGLSYFPVLASEPVAAMIVFEHLIAEGLLEFAFDIYTGQVLWPAGGLVPPNPNPFILDVLYPGVGYLIRMNAPAVLDFSIAEYLPNSIRYIPKLGIENPWNKITNTGQSHIISVQATSIENLHYDDIIGIFNSDGICCGITVYRNDEYPIPLAVYGTDETTPDTDGMSEMEKMQFRIFRNGEELMAEAVFDAQMPEHDGLYVHNGLSSIVNFEIESFGICNQADRISIYPNPATGKFRVSLTSGEEVRMDILNSDGQYIMTLHFSGETDIDLNQYPAGIYIVRFSSPKYTAVKKLIINQ
ncbi:MAG: carboxypeptidase regulatory-like domain-containing protein [Bacteroidales bacterium]